MSRRVLNQKGFSLIETVIAMAIIIIVTVSALTMVTSSLNITKKEIYTSKAQYFAADSLEAFRIAEDAAQFEETIAFAGGYSYFDVDENLYIYYLENSGYTAEISLAYSDINRSEFCVIIKDESGNQIFEYHFQKGDSK